MRQKDEITAKIKALKTISPSTGLAAFVPLEDAITQFFTPTEALEQQISQTLYVLAFDREYRNTIFANNDLMPSLNANFPPGYDDIRDIFDGGGVWDEIISTTDADFVAAFYVSPTDSAGAAASQIMGNTYLENWTQRIIAAQASIIPSLATISSFCEGNAANLGLAVFFEEHGGIVSTPQRRDIAKAIYIDGGYSDIIKSYNLNIHIPSYL